MRVRLLALFGQVMLAVVPASAVAADQYETRVRDLAHARYAEREKAARDLEAAGEPALPALRAALQSPDEELRARATVIVERIDRAVRSRELLAAPTISLKLDRVPLKQAIAELTARTGLPFELTPGTVSDLNRPITLDTGPVPFWKGVHAFYEAAGLIEHASSTTLSNPTADHPFASSTRQTGTGLVPTVRLADGKSIEPTFDDRALRVRPLPAGHALNKYDPSHGEITLHLAVDKVPSLSVQNMIGVEVRHARTDDRRTLAAVYPANTGPISPGIDDPVARRVILNGGDFRIAEAESSQFFPIVLKVPAEQRPKRLSELEGVIVARVLAPQEPLVKIADVFGKGKDRSVVANGLRCSITGADPNATVSPPGIPVLKRVDELVAPPVPRSVATIRVQLISTPDLSHEILNVPVRLKGRPRPFIRINRRSRVMAGNMPQLELRTSDGKVVSSVSCWVASSTFDGTNLTQDIQLAFEKPADGLDGVELTVNGRRSVVVEMPFVLKNVPLP